MADFLIGGLSSQRHEINADQRHHLLEHDKPDVIKGFVSNRTKRKFDAYL